MFNIGFDTGIDGIDIWIGSPTGRGVGVGEKA